MMGVVLKLRQMEEKPLEKRRIRPLRAQVEKIVEPKGDRSAIADLLDLGDDDIENHVQVLADRIRKLGPPPAEPTEPQPALETLPGIDKQNQISDDLIKTAERLRSLLEDE